jgi:hypothetical protein
LSQFVAAFNSSDGPRVRGLLANSFQLQDDLPEGFFDSQDQEKIFPYLDRRMHLGERFLDVVIQAGVSVDVAGMSFVRSTGDERKLYGNAKAVTSYGSRRDGRNCQILKHLVMTSRPQPLP